MNTHRAVIETSVPPKLHPIAAGPKDFCEEQLAYYVEHFPLGEFETALVLAVEPQQKPLTEVHTEAELAEAKAALETEPANGVEAHHKEVIRGLLARIDRLEQPKPQVTTEAELDALGEDAIVADHQGDPWRHIGGQWWIATSSRTARWMETSQLGPFTVLDAGRE